MTGQPIKKGRATFHGSAKDTDPFYQTGSQITMQPSPRKSNPPSSPSAASADSDPNRPETEADGIRAEALRRSRVRRLLKGKRGPPLPKERG